MTGASLDSAATHTPVPRPVLRLLLLLQGVAVRDLLLYWMAGLLLTVVGCRRRVVVGRQARTALGMHGLVHLRVCLWLTLRVARMWHSLVGRERSLRLRVVLESKAAVLASHHPRVGHSRRSLLRLLLVVVWRWLLLLLCWCMSVVCLLLLPRSGRRNQVRHLSGVEAVGQGTLLALPVDNVGHLTALAVAGRDM